MVFAKALAVWLILIAAEVVHGIVRGIFLVPYVGQFRSNQIGVFTGSLIVLAIALLFVRWIGAILAAGRSGTAARYPPPWWVWRLRSPVRSGRG